MPFNRPSSWELSRQVRDINQSIMVCLQVVKLMKEAGSKPTTAAIGDGANDVSMIREAHVGLGNEYSCCARYNIVWYFTG